MESFIALLRGINVGGRTSMPMAELRALAAAAGLTDVRTYIQSGNLLFSAASARRRIEELLERQIERRFGIPVPVIVRAASDWPAYVRSNPFPEAAAAEPNRLMMLLSKMPPAGDAVQRLRERARDGERIAIAADAVWIHFAAGSGSSKLSPSLIDRIIGSPATSRNWRTILKLQEMLQP